MFPYKRIAIVGVGLLGGSLGLALRLAGYRGTIWGVGRSRRNLDTALSRGAIDHGTTDLAEGVRDADLVFLATPVGRFLSLVEACAGALAQGATVTDLGSVKGDLVKRLEELLPPGVSFVGAHPIAGGAEWGIAAARADLFTGATCVITPTDKTPEAAYRHVCDLWEGLGTRVVRMNPYEHDRIYASVSHLPHVVAYALVDAVLGKAGEGNIPLCGRGFRDVTRIAGSSPEIWRDILGLNKENILQALGTFESCLAAYRDALEQGDMDRLGNLMERSSGLRRGMDDLSEEKRSFPGNGEGNDRG